MAACLGTSIYSHLRRSAYPLLSCTQSLVSTPFSTCHTHPPSQITITNNRLAGITAMLNGLDILQSYTDYVRLNTASVFIGGFLGPFVAGVT